MRLVLGSRGSALALAQVELVKQAFAKAEPALVIEVKKITTSGDRRQNERAWIESGAGLKGMFTKEIEESLLAREIDVAVHSCKDLPGQLARDCAVAAVLERGATDDVMISKTSVSFVALKQGARVATNSVRRRRQLQFLRDDLCVEEMRGNVPTRLRKLRESASLDAIVLARAGLERLGYSVAEGLLNFDGINFAVEILPTLPAIGQGAIALEARASDESTVSMLEKINHLPTFQCVRAERELLRLLNGDCTLPVGAKTKISGTRLHMETIVFGEEDHAPRTGEAEGDTDAPELIAQEVFAQLENFSR